MDVDTFHKSDAVGVVFGLLFGQFSYDFLEAHKLDPVGKCFHPLFGCSMCAAEDVI